VARVLIIDDEPSVLMLCRTILTDAGHQVREAPDGPRGLALARTGGFDAVVVDLMMPRMDGFEVMAELRVAQGTRHLPIVVLTAKTQREDQVRSWREGATEFLTKPFPPDQLVAALKRAIGTSPEDHARRRSQALRQLSSDDQEAV
jgi:DNA-binding response OmpR family regulator